MAHNTNKKDFDNCRFITTAGESRTKSKSRGKARNIELQEMQFSSTINSLKENPVKNGITKRIEKMIICFTYAISRCLKKPRIEFRLLINSFCNIYNFTWRINFGI